MSATNASLDQYRGINAIVLGASGFVGRWVARSLVSYGANVNLVVRDRTASEKIFSEYNVDGPIFAVDLNDSDAVTELFARVRPAITFNLAGYGVDRSERDLKTAYQTNAQLVETVCRAVAEYHEKPWEGQAIIHVGSALEYGEINGSLTEDSIPCPTTLYGKSKLAGTNALTNCCRELQIRGVTARLFSVYGPGEHSGRLLPSLAEAATRRQPLPLTSGWQERDFTYVGDVAEGLLRLGLVESAKFGEVVNLALGQLTSVRRFAEIAATVLRIPRDDLMFGALPTRAEEMKHSPVTIDRLQQLTGWRPSTTVEEGIRRTLSFQGLREDHPSKSQLVGLRAV